MGVDQTVSLNYMQWHDGLNLERPYQLVSEDLPEIYGIPRQNFEMQGAPPELIRDIRGEEHQFNNKDEVENVHMPKVEKLLKKSIPGVDEVCFFNWRLRGNRRTPTVSTLGNIHVPTELLVPAHFVHLDQPLKTAIDYAYENMGDRTPWLLDGRLRIFNVWKPFDTPVFDCPLAVCDGSTLHKEDMIVCDNVTKAKVGELILPLHNPDARWHYLHQQKPNEVTIMKIVDSSQEVKAPCCPHCAFDQAEFEPDSPTRKSIEMRALIFTHPTVDHAGGSLDERESFVAQHLEVTDAVSDERKN